MTQPNNRVLNFDVDPFLIGDAVAFAVTNDGMDQIALAICPMKAGIHSYRRAPEGSWEFSLDIHKPWLSTRIQSQLSWVFDGVRRAAWFAVQTWPEGWFAGTSSYSHEEGKPVQPVWCDKVHKKPVVENSVRTHRPARLPVVSE